MLAVSVTYFDTAMVLLQVGSLRILTDPVLDDAGKSFTTGPVVLVKSLPPAATVDGLGHIDAVLLSHDQHADNFDDAGRQLAAKASTILTTPAGADRLKGNARGLAPWESYILHDNSGVPVTVTALPAQHGPDGMEQITGPVTGFLIDWEGNASGPIYLSGDTVPFRGTEEIVGRIAPPSIAILNIGRVQLPATGSAQLSMTAFEAAQFAAALRCEVMLPIHFEGWQHFTQGKSEAEAVFAASPVADRVVWLSRGESYQLPA